MFLYVSVCVFVCLQERSTMRKTGHRARIIVLFFYWPLLLYRMFFCIIATDVCRCVLHVCVHTCVCVCLYVFLCRARSFAIKLAVAKWWWCSALALDCNHRTANAMKRLTTTSFISAMFVYIRSSLVVEYVGSKGTYIIFAITNLKNHYYKKPPPIIRLTEAL